MSKVYVFLADGFEEVEALAPIDVMRRAGIEVDTVSIHEDLTVVGAHNIAIMADTILGLCDFDDASLLFLPGGMPGAANLMDCGTLCDLLIKKSREGTALAAICAAPSILGELELLKGRSATCYPGFEEHLLGADIKDKGFVIKDEKDERTIFTACGPAAAFDLGFSIIEYLEGKETADKVREGMLFGRV